MWIKITLIYFIYIRCADDRTSDTKMKLDASFAKQSLTLTRPAVPIPACRHLANIAETRLRSFVAELNCADKTNNKKLSYRRVTARCVLSVVILPIATQQCRNYLYDKPWPNWWHEIGGLVGGNVSRTMCTQPWRDRVGSHCLRCYKQTDDGRIVYITCIPTTCCGEIF